ncbi:MAG TPA: P-loop NTPase fold protein [Polyangia bacterium]|nr:P-loop NTPase fold protein [Polyangia bacterium]
MAKADGPTSNRARSYDEPAEDDLLGRGPLARTIAEVIRSTPSDFGVRIGVFGEWGSGKTSVLRFVRKILGEQEHVIVAFSPWGITHPAELWQRLGVALLDALEATGGGHRGSPVTRWQLRYDRRILKVLRAGQKLTRFIPHAGPFIEPLAGPMLDAVQDLLRATAEQLTSLAKPGERIVVVVDDLDRADPRLVPPILFALRELFDVRRFSWIVAMDPDVVRAALEEYHPGFARGRDFLEKIVDYPFNLRAPERVSRVALLRRDLAEAGIEIGDTKLYELGPLLPENARELRSIVRHLRSIKGTLARLRPDEIDRRLLLNLVVIHAAAPNLLENLLSSRKALQRISGLKLFKDDGSKRSDQIRQEANERIAALLKRSSIRKQDRARLRKLLLRVGNREYWPPESVVAAGKLLYAPPIVTGREADEALVAGGDVAGLRTWLAGFSRPEGSASEVQWALFDQLLVIHDREMNRAIGAPAEESQKEAIGVVLRAVRALEMLLFEVGAISTVKVAKLEKMRRAFSQWAHFIQPPDYGPARLAERDLLLRLAQSVEIHPLVALNRSGPVRDRDLILDEGDKARRQLNLDLVQVLEERAATRFIELLASEDIGSVFDSWRRAGQYLLRESGLIWTPKFRGQLREALAGERSVARAHNAKELLKEIRSLQGLLSDTELVGLLWRAATSVVPNMRMFDSIERLRGEIEQATRSSLPEPTWWAAKKEQHRLAAMPFTYGPCQWVVCDCRRSS